MEKTIATDLDGCLLSPIEVEKLVSINNKQVINKFDNVLLISGRNSKFIKNICTELKIKENYAAYDGANIYIDGKEVFKEILDSKVAIQIINYVKNNFKDYIIYLMDDQDKIYSLTDDINKVIERENKALKNKPKHAYESIKDLKMIENLINENMHLMKMNVLVDSNQRWNLIRYINDNKLDVCSYPCNHAVEITGPNSNKGKALDYLVNHLNIDKDNVYVVGDDNNDLDMFDNYKNTFLIKKDNYQYLKDNYKYSIKEFKDIDSYLIDKKLHPNNYTIYQITKYYIELTEAMEYTLITYKYDEKELYERIKFLNEDYKKGFFYRIVNALFRKPKKLTLQIRQFLKKYKKETILDMVSDPNLHSRIIYNRDLYLAVSNCKEILDIFLKQKEIANFLEDTLTDLIKTTTTHFDWFFLFNSMNMFISSKVNLLSDSGIYQLDENDLFLLKELLDSFKENKSMESYILECDKLINNEVKFKEDDAYELLNKISIECIKQENKLYTDFNSFTAILEKEIEKLNK